MFDPKKYVNNVATAVSSFWDIRGRQLGEQVARNSSDAGNRGAVTAGKQMDGFIDLIVTVAQDLGVPNNCIYTKNNHLPGYFRPTKDWDILIITPKNRLIAVIELKSQVGSFGNNFNNRTEEVLGSAVDLWTAFRENIYPDQVAPWVGYLLVVEDCAKSTAKVRVAEPHFDVMSDFKGTSYMERYALLCKKLIRERLYTSTVLIGTSDRDNYHDCGNEISINTFLSSFAGYIQSAISEFKENE